MYVRRVLTVVFSTSSSIAGHHILQRIVKLYMEKELRGGEYLVDYVKGRVAEFSCDRQGCCFLQRVHPLANDAQRQWIREALLADLPAIAQHCYGNYVVQYTLLAFSSELVLSIICMCVVSPQQINLASFRAAAP